MPDPLSKSELAQLLALFADEPLPRALQRLISAHLAGEAGLRAGRRPRRLTTSERAQGDLLPILYRHALQWARAERRRRIAEATRTRRGPSPDSVPPATELACDRIRRQLPRFKDMTTGAILNEVSRAKPRADMRLARRGDARRDLTGLKELRKSPISVTNTQRYNASPKGRVRFDRGPD